MEIVLPAGADESGLEVSVNGENVSAEFVRCPNSRAQGLIADLPLGQRRLVADLGGAAAPVEMVLTNHPTGGPILAGPQVEPWLCRTEELGLGPATDAQCNAPSKVEFFYRAAGSQGAWKRGRFRPPWRDTVPE